MGKIYMEKTTDTFRDTRYIHPRMTSRDMILTRVICGSYDAIGENGEEEEL